MFHFAGRSPTGRGSKTDAYGPREKGGNIKIGAGTVPSSPKTHQRNKAKNNTPSPRGAPAAVPPAIAFKLFTPPGLHRRPLLTTRLEAPDPQFQISAISLLFRDKNKQRRHSCPPRYRTSPRGRKGAHLPPSRHIHTNAGKRCRLPMQIWPSSHPRLLVRSADCVSPPPARPPSPVCARKTIPVNLLNFGVGQRRRPWTRRDQASPPLMQVTNLFRQNEGSSRQYDRVERGGPERAGRQAKEMKTPPDDRKTVTVLRTSPGVFAGACRRSAT